MEFLEELLEKAGLGVFVNKERTQYHFVFVEAPEEVVGPEIVLWGEANWWPPKSSLKFTRKTAGEVQAGTRYEQRFQALLSPVWNMEVTRLIPHKEVERTFSSENFKGYERVSVEGRYNGTKVTYFMRYRITGSVNRFLWFFIFKRKHGRNIRMALAALKNYAEAKVGSVGEQEGESGAS